MPTAKHGHASIDIAAAPDLVYDLIADITRMGEWSPECYRCEWLPPATAPVGGARFRGYNKLGRHRWETTAVITTATAGQEFSFTVVHDKTGRPETVWSYRLAPSSAGTMLTEAFEFLWCPIGNRISELLIPRGGQVNRGIQHTLRPAATQVHRRDCHLNRTAVTDPAGRTPVTHAVSDRHLRA